METDDIVSAAELRARAAASRESVKVAMGALQKHGVALGVDVSALKRTRSGEASADSGITSSDDGGTAAIPSSIVALCSSTESPSESEEDGSAEEDHSPSPASIKQELAALDDALSMSDADDLEDPPQVCHPAAPLPACADSWATDALLKHWNDVTYRLKRCTSLRCSTSRLAGISDELERALAARQASARDPPPEPVQAVLMQRFWVLLLQDASPSLSDAVADALCGLLVPADPAALAAAPVDPLLPSFALPGGIYDRGTAPDLAADRPLQIGAASLLQALRLCGYRGPSGRSYSLEAAGSVWPLPSFDPATFAPRPAWDSDLGAPFSHPDELWEEPGATSPSKSFVPAPPVLPPSAPLPRSDQLRLLRVLRVVRAALGARAAVRSPPRDAAALFAALLGLGHDPALEAHWKLAVGAASALLESLPPPALASVRGAAALAASGLMDPRMPLAGLTRAWKILQDGAAGQEVVEAAQNLLLDRLDALMLRPGSEEELRSAPGVPMDASVPVLDRSPLASLPGRPWFADGAAAAAWASRAGQMPLLERALRVCDALLWPAALELRAGALRAWPRRWAEEEEAAQAAACAALKRWLALLKEVQRGMRVLMARNQSVKVLATHLELEVRALFDSLDPEFVRYALDG